ncbi:protein ADM2 [Coregonus clupeaformis]|uniref:protein ADM2 n=1 Tax=Coregonus clupeaformis TaxID=59861 RepID=UPI001E1C8F6C|nr:protein ADM2 [Coregonus clupeaformis]
MRSLLPVAVYCISLLSLQQLLALPVADRLERNRLELLKKLHALREEEIFTPKTGTKLASPTDSSPSSDLQPSIKWLSGYLLRDTPPTVMNTAHLEALVWARGEEGVEPQRTGSRGRRHAHSGLRGGPHRPQLMRVGCALGTCQVQNLSHRLYQLIGQSGREDSSPINPRSPHSYG